MAQVSREAKHLSPKEEKGRNDEPNERTGDVPGPGVDSFHVSCYIRLCRAVYNRSVVWFQVLLTKE